MKKTMIWQTQRYRIALEQPKVMGIVNVTPDSFAQVGNSDDARQAVRHAEQLLKEGADILDIGAESTRPGATPHSGAAEWRRLAPVLQEVLAWNVPISVDTYHASTMQHALDCGVDIINDVWGLRQDGAQAVVARHGNCGVCLMHMHGEPRTMHIAPMSAPDVVLAVGEFLVDRALCLETAGVAPERICLDPGIGFGKTVEQNFTLLAQQQRLQQLMQQRYPLLLGWSRKSSLGAATGLAAPERLVPSVVAAVLAVQAGAHIVRVHDVAATRAGLAVLAAVRTKAEREQE